MRKSNVGVAAFVAVAVCASGPLTILVLVREVISWIINFVAWASARDKKLPAIPP